jgi:hypothetical protein
VRGQIAGRVLGERFAHHAGIEVPEQVLQLRRVDFPEPPVLTLVVVKDQHGRPRGGCGRSPGRLREQECSRSGQGDDGAAQDQKCGWAARLDFCLCIHGFSSAGTFGHEKTGRHGVIAHWTAG